MFSKSFILGALTAFLSSANAKDAEMVMRYKIAQVTDLHFGESETADKLTAGYLLSMLPAEQPSLVVITGVIGSGSFEPFYESYKKLEGVFDLGMANGYTG